MRRGRSVLVGSVAGLILAACASAPPAPTPSPPLPQEEAPTVQPTETAKQEVTGDVFYVERIALSPEAVAQVEVVEVAPGGNMQTVIAEWTQRSPGQVPIRFSVAVAPERLRPDGQYALRARITDGDRVFTTRDPVPVLTQGHPSQGVRVRVRSGG